MESLRTLGSQVGFSDFLLFVAHFGQKDPRKAFNIDLVFVDEFPPYQIEIIKKAARRWEEIIVGDLPDMDLRRYPLQFWKSGLVDYYIDDIKIFVYKDDLEEGVAGKGGPDGPSEAYYPERYARSFRGLPCVGQIILDRHFFDSGDYPDRHLFVVTMHEIGHALGIGTRTLRRSIITDEDAYFPGPKAIKAFDDSGGKDYAEGGKVPLDDDGGHWRKDILVDELMVSGWAYWDAPRPTSIVTIQALADLGYTVDVTQAEPFKIEGLSKRAMLVPFRLRCGVGLTDYERK